MADYDLEIKWIRIVLEEIRDEFKRFNDREEAKQPKLPEGWTLDIPVS